MSKGKILVVDDEPAIVQAVAGRLEHEDYEVITANDGFQATETAFREQPDLIILDIGMPAGNGHEVVRCLRAHPRTRAIPVIFLTGHTSTEDYQKAIDEGVERYITKPYRSEELLAAVDDLMCSFQKV